MGIKNYFLLCLILSLVLIVGCGTDTKKEEAKAFSLDVVKTYFSNDCNQYYSFLSDNIYVDGNPQKKESVIDKVDLCGGFDNIVSGSHTYQEYLNSYEISILGKREYSSKFEDWTCVSSKDDYLFIGYEVLRGKENFMSDDALIFFVRKEGNDWKIIGGFDELCTMKPKEMMYSDSDVNKVKAVLSATLMSVKGSSSRLTQSIQIHEDLKICVIDSELSQETIAKAKQSIPFVKNTNIYILNKNNQLEDSFYIEDIQVENNFKCIGGPNVEITLQGSGESVIIS